MADLLLAVHNKIRLECKEDNHNKFYTLELQRYVNQNTGVLTYQVMSSYAAIGNKPTFKVKWRGSNLFTASRELDKIVASKLAKGYKTVVSQAVKQSTKLPSPEPQSEPSEADKTIQGLEFD